MTTMAQASLGASSTFPKWSAIDWPAIARNVQRLQTRIAKAVREERRGKVKALQWLLAHASSAKLLAVRRVVRSAGRNTAGVDGITWKTSEEKRNAARSLQRRGYQPLPSRRIYIPKKNGKQRPLGIPACCDRAQQALHLLTLEPIAETTADRNSYGFRPRRSVADAIEQCFIVLAQKTAAQWILEGDIKACFDQISHDWLRRNVAMDKEMLRKWLAAGYMEKGVVYPTEEGTPQGGVASPVLANMVLDGLEKVAQKAAPSNQKIHFVRYADDFIITGASKEVLEAKVKPAVVSFLKERGLTLSEEKTHITHIDDGFDFLGFNVRKYQGKLLIKPSKKAVTRFLADTREFIKANATAKTESLIRQLNRKIRGWANHYRHVVAKKTFNHIDHAIFLALLNWINRRHPNKPTWWKRKRYFRRAAGRNWVFFAPLGSSPGRASTLDLFRASGMPIVRHVKIQGAATLHNPAFSDYFARRTQARTAERRKGRPS